VEGRLSPSHSTQTLLTAAASLRYTCCLTRKVFCIYEKQREANDVRLITVEAAGPGAEDEDFYLRSEEQPLAAPTSKK